MEKLAFEREERKGGNEPASDRRTSPHNRREMLDVGEQDER
jgi:hypothetical protein